MSYQTLLYGKDQGVATLSFNRPDKLNAINAEMWTELALVLDRVEKAIDIRVLLLTGQGRAFMAGADVQVFTGLDPLTAREFSRRTQELLARLERLEMPVIAAVHGYALGGGLEVALACDLIYAAASAKFGLPEINLGILPCVGGTQRLPRLVGLGAAKEICFTGRHLDAAEAKALGLVARIFPDAAFQEECLAVARSLAQKGRVALAALKRALNQGFKTDLATGLTLEADALALCFTSPDAREGALAFLEKRLPRFE